MRFHALLAMLSALPLCATAQTYKCKQADGKLTFQDQPCQGSATGSQIVVRPVAPSADPAEIQKLRAATLKGKEVSTQRQSVDDYVKARNEQADAYTRGVRCDAARRNLGVLKTQRPVFTYDNNGDKKYVEDASRQAEIAAAQRAVAENCN